MAILGDATSYTIGAKVGPKIFNRPQSRLLKPEHVQAAHAFYEKHGGKAIIIARFVPLVRTFVPVIAGVAGMTYRHSRVQHRGRHRWVASMTLGGYFLGSFPEPRQHVEKVIIVIVLLSVLPMVFEYVRAGAPQGDSQRSSGLVGGPSARESCEPRNASAAPGWTISVHLPDTSSGSQRARRKGLRRRVVSRRPAMRSRTLLVCQRGPLGEADD